MFEEIETGIGQGVKWDEKSTSAGRSLEVLKGNEIRKMFVND